MLPIILYLDITNKCNMNCPHCYNSFINQKKDLSQKEILESVDKIIDSFGINKIVLGGGESLLREDIYELIREFKKRELKVHLTSNGLLITERIIRDLQKIGLDEIQISIDGFEKSHDLFRGRKNSWKKAIDSLEKINQSKIKSYAGITLNKYNKNEIIDLISFLENKCSLVNLIRIRESQKSNKNKVNLQGKEIFEIYKKVILNFDRKDKKIDIRIHDPLINVLLKTLNLKKETEEYFYGNDCVAFEFICAIDSGGFLIPCPMLPQRLIKIDNSKTSEEIIATWEDAKKEVIQEGTCNKIKLCKKGCLANRWFIDNTLKKCDPLCIFKDNDN